MALNLDIVCLFSKVAPSYLDLGSIPFSNANKMMAALSRVLEEARKLGQMSAEDYHRAIASSTAAGNRQLSCCTVLAKSIALKVCQQKPCRSLTATNI